MNCIIVEGLKVTIHIHPEPHHHCKLHNNDELHHCWWNNARYNTITNWITEWVQHHPPKMWLIVVLVKSCCWYSCMAQTIWSTTMSHFFFLFQLVKGCVVQWILYHSADEALATEVDVQMLNLASVVLGCITIAVTTSAAVVWLGWYLCSTVSRLTSKRNRRTSSPPIMIPGFPVPLQSCE